MDPALAVSVSKYRKYVVVGAAVGVNLILGSLYSYGVIASALVVQWKWSKTDAALPFTVSTVSFAIMMIFAGRLQDRFGPRLAALLGGIMFGLGMLLSKWANTPLVLASTFGLVGGVGLGLGYSGTTPAAIKWFPPRKKGLIAGIVVAGVGLAATYTAPLTDLLLRNFGIPDTFLVLGLAATVLIVLMSLLLVNPPAGYTAAQPAAKASSAAPAPSARETDWREMLQTSGFYRLWTMMTLATSAGLMMLMHMSIIAKQQAGWAWGFVPIAVLAAFNSGGRVVSGFISDRIGRTQTMILAFAIQAVNMAAFGSYTTPALLTMGASITGLCYGAVFTLMPAATADLYGVRNLGINYGLVFTSFGLGGLLGPQVAGYIRDHTGSYQTAYNVSAGLLVVAAMIAASSFRSRTDAPKHAQAGKM
jgi:MFS transporter, OFA family, oxalate/formate antiporter